VTINVEGISKTVFISGIILAIMTSSIISTIVVMQIVPSEGLEGDNGDTGNLNETGSSQFPLAFKRGETAIISASYPAVWDEMVVNNQGNLSHMSLQISVEEESVLIIVLNTYLRFKTSNECGWFHCDIRAVVDDELASPNETIGIEITRSAQNDELESAHAYSGMFTQQVSAGTHNVRIEWALVGINEYNFMEAQALSPYLTVYALPSE
jgi:hypothetical protein